MFARKPGKGITLEMYIRNTQVNIKKKKKKERKNCHWIERKQMWPIEK